MPNHTPLRFIDHDRQWYAATNPSAEAGEFMVGGYAPDGDGGVDERGEFLIVLHDLPGLSGLSPNLQVFADGYGALRECIAAGLLDALDAATIKSRDDLAAVLESVGLVDASETPRAQVA